MQLEIDNVQLFDIFKVPLARSDFYISEKEKQKIINTFYKIEQSLPILENSYPVGSYTSFDTVAKIFDLTELSSIKEHALKSAQDLHTKVGLEGELELKKSWFSIHRKHSYHGIHHHCPDIWSGVYYLQAEQEDASISFLNNNLVSTSWPYKSRKSQTNDYTSSEKTCKVSGGMMLLFPSYLYHHVTQQVTDRERITIAFNLNLK